MRARTSWQALPGTVGSGTSAGEGVNEPLEPADMFGIKEIPVKEYNSLAVGRNGRRQMPSIVERHHKCNLTVVRRALTAPRDSRPLAGGNPGHSRFRFNPMRESPLAPNPLCFFASIISRLRYQSHAPPFPPAQGE